MSPLEYLGGALESWQLYVVLALLFVALHWVLIRRWAVGIFDPLLLLLFANALGWAIVWFMYLRDDIATRYVASFTAAQLALYVGMEVGHRFRPRIGPPDPAPRKDPLPAFTLWISAAVHVSSTLATWVIAGVPLFRESRLGAFQGSGGFGILERLSDASALIALFSAIYLLLRQRGRWRTLPIYGFLLWFLVSIGLSGSKGALLGFGQYVLSIVFVFGSLRERSDHFWGGRMGKVMLVAATLFAMGVLATQQESDLGTTALALVYRIVSYGDVYIFAYPDATIESLKGGNALVGMFGGFLSTFRLFPQELLQTNIGYQLTGIVFPDLDLLVGPNPQHPVFGYHYFGAFGFVFSFVLGVVTMAAHSAFYFRRHRTFVTGLLAFLVYFALIGISADFDYAMSRLASSVIGLVVVFVPVLSMCPQAVLLRPRRPRLARLGGEDTAR
jgi:hypothetical protein